jgi:hypothetical protein
VIAITSKKQTDLGDGTKLVFAKIGIKNNDSLWGMVIGPDSSDEKATQKIERRVSNCQPTCVRLRLWQPGRFERSLQDQPRRIKSRKKQANTFVTINFTANLTKMKGSLQTIWGFYF